MAFLNSLEAIGAGLGLGGQQIMQQQQAAARMALARMAQQQGQLKLQEQQQQQQMLNALNLGYAQYYGGGGQTQPFAPMVAPQGGQVQPPSSGLPWLQPDFSFGAMPPTAPRLPDPLQSGLQQGTATMEQLEGGAPGSVGPYGELGPDQVMPATARQYGYTPEQAMTSRAPGRGIYAQLYGQSAGAAAGDPQAAEREALVGYNRGAGAMQRYEQAGDNVAAVPNLSPAYRRAVQSLTPMGAAVAGPLIAGASPETQQQGDELANMVARQLGAEAGRMRNAVTAIEGSDYPPAVKALAVAQLAATMAPQDRMALSMQMLMLRQLGSQERQQNEAFGGAVRLPDGRYAQPKKGGGYEILPGEPITLQKTEESGANAFGSVNDLMRRWHEDFVKQQNREPTTDEIAKERSKLSTEGQRLGVFNQGVVRRLTIAANDIAKTLDAATTLGDTTLGLFGGAQASLGPDMGENVKKALANKATPEASQMLRTLANGAGRSLAILAAGGASTGLVGLSQQLAQDLPAANDTGREILMKYADMRQITEAAIEAIQADPVIPDQQKQFLAGVLEKIQKVVPFTTSDVARAAAGDRKSITQLAEQFGVSASAAPAPTGTQGQQQPAPAAQEPTLQYDRATGNFVPIR